MILFIIPNDCKMNLEEQLETVRLLQETILMQESSLRLLKELLDTQRKVLYDVCDKTTGHDFIKEHNGDYHRSGWDYTCRTCGYWKR